MNIKLKGRLKHLQGESLYNLRKYLTNNHNPPLSKKEVELLETYIQQIEKDHWELVDKFMDSTLFRYAFLELIRENLIEKRIINGQVTWQLREKYGKNNSTEAFTILGMKRIIDKGYCQRQHKLIKQLI